MSRPPATPPQLVGFQFAGLLGSGGFADVFRYTETGLGRSVAVKVMLGEVTGPEQASFRAEAQVMARLGSHPSVVSIFQAAVTPDGRPYLVMEYCPPPHLGVQLRTHPLAVAKALELTVQLAGAVETAHRLGILHRDIKPANILFTEFGRAALTDFGISASTAVAAAGQGVGMSVPWAPPEQLTAGAPTGVTSDVYSLAATLWTALVGRSPFQLPGGPNDLVATSARVRAQPVPPTRREDVPASLEALLQRAMAKDPARRPPSALAFAQSLQAVQTELGLPVTAVEVRDDRLSGDQVVDEGHGGTRITGFVSIDPDGPETPDSWTRARPGAAPPPPPPSPPPLDQTVVRPPPPGRRSRGRQVLAAVGALVVLGGVGALAATQLGGGSGAGTPERPVPAASTPPQDPIVVNVPSPADVTVERVGRRELDVRWSNPAPEAGDTYRYKLADDLTDHPWTDTPDTAGRLTGQPGRLCVLVMTVRADGRTSESAQGCPS